MTDAAQRLDTERLILRMFREDDFEAYYAKISSDGDVMRYLGDGQPLTRSIVWRQLAMIVGHWQLKGYGMWAVEERSTGELIGRIGLFNPEGWPGFELGWVLGRAYWDAVTRPRAPAGCSITCSPTWGAIT